MTLRVRRWVPLAAIGVAVVVIASCSSSDKSTDGAGTESGRTSTTPAPVVVRLSIEDLAAMTVPHGELGPAYSGLVFDWFFGGFEDNEERAWDKSVDSDDERADLARTGRLGAYLNMYIPPDTGGAPAAGVQRVYTSAHLFGDPAGASAYLKDSNEESRAEVGKPPEDGAPGITSRQEFPVDGIGDEVIGSVSQGPSLRSTRIVFRRGRVLAVAQLARSDQKDDGAEMLRIARRLQERVDAVLAGTLRGIQGDPSAAIGIDRVIAMPLPAEQLPARYARLGEDIMAGRFQDNEERLNTTSWDTADDRADDERFGRVVGYGLAYSSDFADQPAPPNGFVGTGVTVFGDGAGASGWLADDVMDHLRLAGKTVQNMRVRSVSGFAVTGVGDEAAGVSLNTSVGTVVIVEFRVGRLVGNVVLGPPAGGGTAEAIGVAGNLDDRIAAAMGGA